MIQPNRPYPQKSKDIWFNKYLSTSQTPPKIQANTAVEEINWFHSSHKVHFRGERKAQTKNF